MNVKCKCDKMHTCTRGDGNKTDVSPNYFQFECNECGWHEARCLLCSWRCDKSNKTAGKRGSRLYVEFFKKHYTKYHSDEAHVEQKKRQQVHEDFESVLPKGIPINVPAANDDNAGSETEFVPTAAGDAERLVCEASCRDDRGSTP